MSLDSRMFAAIAVRLAAPQEGFSLTAPLVFFYGHTSLQENPELFKRLVVRRDSELERMRQKGQGCNRAVFVRDESRQTVPRLFKSDVVPWFARIAFAKIMYHFRDTVVIFTLTLAATCDKRDPIPQASTPVWAPCER